MVWPTLSEEQAPLPSNIFLRTWSSKNWKADESTEEGRLQGQLHSPGKNCRHMPFAVYHSFSSFGISICFHHLSPLVGLCSIFLSAERMRLSRWWRLVVPPRISPWTLWMQFEVLQLPLCADLPVATCSFCHRCAARDCVCFYQSICAMWGRMGRGGKKKGTDTPMMSEPHWT